MALKGSSGGGKSKASRPSRPSGGSSPKSSSSSGSAPKFSTTAGSSAKYSEPDKSFSGKQPGKPIFGGGGSGGNRMLWLILGGLVLLALCCICSLAIAWTYGDSAMDLLRQMQFQ